MLMRNNPAHPRPEYPRPDFQRGLIEGIDWLNLNGPWKFRFDGERRGIDEHWFRPDAPEWSEEIIVPFCWESLAAWGEGDAAGNDNYFAKRVFRDPLQVTKLNYRSAPRYEVGWYRRKLTIPNNEHWEGRRVVLTVGAADFFTDCWSNGVHLGRHEGGYTPFEFDVTDTLTMAPDGTRSATIVLRVEDPMDNHEQPVGKQWQWYTTTSGIWQTVYVEPRATSHIDSIRIVPDLDTRSAQFLLHCEEGEGCAVEVEIKSPRGSSKTTTLEVADSVAEGWTPIDPLVLWDINDPNLYEVVLRLKCDDRVLDTVCTYFGMRSIDSGPSDPQDPNSPAVLRINGVPRYLRGALYQSYYPEGVYTAGDAQTLRDDIAYAKKVGFNFLRVHIKIDDPLLLYYADTMGMMLMCDLPNFGEGGDTPLGRERFETMMRKAIQRDFNHPSIVAWCLFNETWGFGGQVELVNAVPHAG
jgi:beta-galactosidase/beta-glucuronidase